MIGHHIAQRACRLIEGSAAFDADRFGHGHLHVIDAVAVPDRLEHAIGKAQRHDVLNRLLAEEVVDPENLIFAECPQHAGVKRARRLQAMAEGFLEHHPPPVAKLSVRAHRLIGQPRLTQMLNGWNKELFGDGKVEDNIALCAVSLFSFGERSAQVAGASVCSDRLARKTFYRQGGSKPLR